MSKFFALLITLYGLLLLLSFAGINTGQQGFIDNLSLISDTSGFWYYVKWVLLLALGAGLVVSALTQSSPDIYLAASFALAAALPLTSSFIGLVNYVHGTYSEWVYWVTFVIIMVMGIAYLAMAIDWVLNRGGN